MEIDMYVMKNVQENVLGTSCLDSDLECTIFFLLLI